MKKICLMLLALLLMGSASLQNVSAHYDTAYWHDEYIDRGRSGWMSAIPNDRKISEISIPGTHDSMAHKSNLTSVDQSRTQSLSLENQLIAGIRYLDIRLMHDRNKFSIYHGIVYTGYDFDDVLTKTKAFLRKNPEETIVMRVKQEKTSASDEEMKKLFDTYYNRYSDLFWKPGQSSNRNNPTMGELRGKILLLPDVWSLRDYGINYRDVDKQDEYEVPVNWDLYRKWEYIKSFLNKTNNGSRNVISINYLNGSAKTGVVYPYFVASGHSSPATNANRLITGATEPGFHSYYPDFPRVNWFGVIASIAFEGMNTLTANFIDKEGYRHSGIIAADFPGDRLINNIIDLNFISNDIHNGIFSIVSAANTNLVIDINNEFVHNDASLYPDWRQKSANQSFRFVYDNRIDAWQIKSRINEKYVLAWNKFQNSNNVFITENQSKYEHYWKMKKQPDGSYAFHNWSNESLVLGTSKVGTLASLKVGSPTSGFNWKFYLR